MATNTADGSVVIPVDMNVSQAEKKLNKLTNDIEKSEKKIRDITQKRDAAEKKGVFDAATLDAEKAKLQSLKDTLADLKSMSKDKGLDVETREYATASIQEAGQAVADQQTRVRELQAEYNKTANSVEKYNSQLADATNNLEIQRTEAGALAQQIDKANGPAALFGHRMRDAGDGVLSLENRIKKLATRVLVFSVITMALRGIRQWIGNVIKENDEARKSMAQLRAALLTLAQPIVQVVIPAFVTLVKVLSSVVTAIASIVSRLFGTTIEQSAQAAKNLNDEKKALTGVGSAAKKASKQLAAFDEINQIGEKDVDAGGTVASGISPDFSFLDSTGTLFDKLREKIESLIGPIGLVAAGLALWKISELLPGQLGDIATKIGWIAVAIGGLMILWDGLKDAWENGVDWVNMAEMVGGLALAAIGLSQAFGPLAAGISLIVGGLAMMATGFNDASDNGWNLQNTLLTIAGIMATGLGISLIAGPGGWIAVLVAAIMSILFAIAVVTGHGEELINGIQETLDGFIDFFKGVFIGDLDLAMEGVNKIFEGFKKTVYAVFESVKDFFNGFLDWLDKKTDGKFHNIIQGAKDFFTVSIEELEKMFGGIIDGMKQSFNGLVKFFAGVFTMDFDLALEGIKDVVNGFTNQIISVVETMINYLIDGVNYLISKINSALASFEVPDWIPGIGGSKLGVKIPSIPRAQLPRLATGAVIPPNREFMAVLGDQKHGTNIEAPADLIRSIVREEINSSGANRGEEIKIVFEGDLAALARLMNPHIERAKTIAGGSLVSIGSAG